MLRVKPFRFPSCPFSRFLLYEVCLFVSQCSLGIDGQLGHGFVVLGSLSCNSLDRFAFFLEVSLQLSALVPRLELGLFISSILLVPVGPEFVVEGGSHPQSIEGRHVRRCAKRHGSPFTLGPGRICCFGRGGRFIV